MERYLLSPIVKIIIHYVINKRTTKKNGNMLLNWWARNNFVSIDINPKKWRTGYLYPKLCSWWLWQVHNEWKLQYIFKLCLLLSPRHFEIDEIDLETVSKSRNEDSLWVKAYLCVEYSCHTSKHWLYSSHIDISRDIELKILHRSTETISTRCYL